MAKKLNLIKKYKEDWLEIYHSGPWAFLGLFTLLAPAIFIICLPFSVVGFTMECIARIISGSKKEEL